MNYLILTLFSIYLTGCAQTPQKPDFTDPTSEINRLWKNYSQDTRNQVRNRFDSIRILVPHENKVLFFTKSNHPVHKSLVQRQIHYKNNQVGIHSEGITEADPQKFQRWLNTFLQQDRALKNKFSPPSLDVLSDPDKE